ncbi:N-acetyltransferase family protein [Dactylosporangium sp. CA-139066]|uniref:GNAT family N-acetyltransferase n=1 Tax=Dactylosporangium sp. CA-139066 TaxID=3239930 RepID=UPI003D8DBFD1
MNDDARGVTVRQAQPSDLTALVAALGQPHYFAIRLDGQPEVGILLVAARADGSVVGSAFLRLAPAEEAELRERLPGAPVLMHVEVVPEQQRNGVGKMIVHAAEEYARAHGRSVIALGVRPDNDGARKLYAGAGYTDWGLGPINAVVKAFDDGGERDDGYELCEIMVKALDGE